MSGAYEQVKSSNEVLSTYLTQYHDDSESYIQELKDYLQSHGFDQETQDFVSQGLDNSSSFQSLFGPDAIAAAKQALAQTGTAMGIGALHDLSKVYSGVGSTLLAQSAAPSASLGSALTNSAIQLIQPANDNTNLSILNKARALGTVAAVFGLSYMAMEIALSDNPQSEAIKQGAILATGSGLGWLATSLLGLSGAPAIVTFGTAALIASISAYAIEKEWSNIYNTALQLKDAGKSAIEIAGYMGDEISSIIDNLLDTTGEALDQLVNDILEFGQDVVGDISEAVTGAANGLVEGVIDLVLDVADFFTSSKSHLSPLVLDIDGGGIQLVSVDSANAVYFDLNGNDFATTTGWTAGGDGLLAIDLDEDGIINNGTELFGDQTGYGNGFQALGAYDSNSDGVISSADTDWSKLVVWIDANQNGFSDDGEIFGLDDLNITEISLSYSDVYYDYSGNIIRQESSFTMNGSTRSIVDAYFAVDNLNSTYVGDYTLDPQTLFLPGARGYGTLPDLYIAMSLDNDTQDPDSLMSLVTDFTALTLSEIFAADTVALDAINGILFRWAGVEDVATDSRGQYIDARKLEFLEAMMGEEWQQLGTYDNPMWIAAADLEKAFEVAQGYYFATLVAQTAGKEFLLGDYYFNSQTGGFEGITGIDTDMLADLETEALALTSTQDRLTFWGNVVRLVEYTVGVDNLDYTDQTALDDAINGSDIQLTLSEVLDSLVTEVLANSITGTGSNDTITGTNGYDIISGQSGDDTLDGSLGNDQIFGEYGNDTLIGGEGDDILYAGPGDDTFIYNVGDGWDVIDYENWTGTSEPGDVDKLVFGAGITANDLTFSRVNDKDVVIDIDTGTYTGQIYIAHQVNHTYYGTTYPGLTYIQFSDSSTLYLSDIDFTYTAPADGGQIQGVQSGGGENDTLIGSTATDYFAGYDGNDTYVIGANFGNDNQITEELSEGTDTISFVDGITPDDLYIWTDSSGYLHIQDVNDSHNNILITGALTSTGADMAQRIEYITFSDSTVWDLSAGMTLTGTEATDRIHGAGGNDVISGGAGYNDYLYGYAGNDVLIGGAGTDYLYGGSGDDTYVFEAGFGDMQPGYYNEDAVYEELAEGTDTIHMGGSYTPDNVYTWTDQYGWLYIQSASDPADTLKVQATLGASGSDVADRIEYITFSDSTVWDLSEGLILNDSADGHRLHGSAGHDVMDAGGGNDDLYGYAGNDLLTGAAGSDYLVGGLGDDTYIFEAGFGDYQPGYYNEDRIVEALAEGTDTIHMGSSYTPDNVYSWTDSSGWFYIQSASDPADTLKVEATLGASGTDVGDRVEYVTFSDSTVWDLTEGLILNDNNEGHNMRGSAGADVINGAGGFDYIYGYDGDDILIGGAGADYLSGGSGADTFVFEAATAFDASDTIADFSALDDDVIDLRDLLDGGYDPLTDALADFVQSTESGGSTLLSVDYDGLGTAYGWTQIAMLSGTTGLGSADDMLTAGQLLVA